jgi:hypothetical protein
VQAAALTRERGLSQDGWARAIGPESLIDALLAPIDDKQRRALLALTALPGVALEVQHISSIAEVTDIEPALTTLVRHGLVIRSHSRHHLVEGVADRLRRTDDLKPWVNRAVTYFTAWAERYRRSLTTVLAESEALLRAQQCAVDARRWGEVLRLGQLLEGALIIGARWGAWAITLEHCLAAAKASGDRSAEAWALHEIGTRALCLGELGIARASLGQAVKLRETLHDDAAAAASRRTLGFVLAPVADAPREPSVAPLDTVREFESLPLQAAAPPSIRTSKRNSVGALTLTAVVFAVIGWFGYLAIAEGLSFGPSRASQPETPRPAATGSTLETIADDPPLTPEAPASAAAQSVSIRTFTARPGSVATAGPTELCYAVNHAFLARIEPGIGEVDPTSTLSCHRVAPARTTTYQLTAYGRDGQHVTQQILVVVR